MVQPAFSYNYDNKPFSDVSDNPIKAVINKKVYDEFDAVEWYVTYENTSNVNSKILSQIKDCDILLKLPEYHRESPTLRITEEAPKVMWMQGNLEGEAYSFDDERSAQEFSRMLKSRNPIIETDKNIELLVQQNIAIQAATDKHFKISLLVSMCAALFAGLTFILSLIQIFYKL